jgi:hypothetical protein
MTPRDAARQLAARFALMVARYWSNNGQMTYTHRGVAIPVYVIPACGAHASMRQWGSAIEQELKNNFVIPTQAGFPPEDGPLILDSLTDEDGVQYSIRKWSVDSEQVCYTVDEAVATKVRQFGAVGV